jgi:uncharacterized membrane protein
VRTLLYFCGIAAIIMGLVATIIVSFRLAFLGLVLLGLFAIAIGFIIPEEM